MSRGRGVLVDGRRRVAAAVLASALLAGCSGSTDDTDPAEPVTEATTVPSDTAAVPDGWVVRRAPGFTVAVPPEWESRPEDQRAAPGAALEVGVPFTGQSVPPPLLIGFVEREEVGPLDAREQVLRLQLENGLPGATLGDSRTETVAGAVDALSFDVSYRSEGGESVLGTPLDPYTVRQRELVIETPGLPKYGLRYAAAEDDFDAELWDQVVGSVVITPDTAPSTPA